MRSNIPLSILLVATLTLTAMGQPTVTLTLDSPQAGHAVSAGATVDWTITVGVSTGDNEGLALISCDLVQAAGNPAWFDIPPGDAGSIDATMQNFNAPDGFSNPAEGGATTGYVGTQRGIADRKNLLQIGGGQNTFGAALPPGTGVGESAAIVAGVGQAGSQPVLSGSFPAPAAEGTYTFSLANVIANVITELNTPPAFSLVGSAAVDLSAARFSFTVGDIVLGDIDGDGDVDDDDQGLFIQVLLGIDTGDPAHIGRSDLNGSGAADGADVQPFVQARLN